MATFGKNWATCHHLVTLATMTLPIVGFEIIFANLPHGSSYNT